MDTIINFIHSIDNNITSFILDTVNNQDPVMGLALIFGIPTVIAFGLVYVCKLFEYLNERFEYFKLLEYLNQWLKYFNLIHKIKTTPKDADTLIKNSHYHFSTKFIQKYASDSLIFKRELSDAKIYANRNADL